VLALRFGVLQGVAAGIADLLANKLVVVPSNPVAVDAQGNVYRLLPEEQSSGNVVAGWLPAGARLAMAFGTLPADVLVSAARRAPEPAVLFYVTNDDRAAGDVERLIRVTGFEPAKVGGLERSTRLEVGGDLHDRIVGPAAARALIGAGWLAPLPRTARLRGGASAEPGAAPKNEGAVGPPHDIEPRPRCGG
jgi:predicted dinucleotide-binding enzyme